MNCFLRTTLFASVAFASCDGDAKIDKPCIVTLEAHEAAAPFAPAALATKLKAGCLVAVAGGSPAADVRRRALSADAHASRKA